MDKIHCTEAEQVLRDLNTDGDRGLSQEQAARRLEQYGENRLAEPRRAGIFLRVLAQLRDPMILVLLAAAGLSLFAGEGRDWLDAAIILTIVIFNTVLSVSQEDNAQKAIEALSELSAPKSKVLRDGQEQVIESAKLVPGDILLLSAGDWVPADGRLLWTAGLKTDESSMTGESLPVEKDGTGPLPENTPLAERRNMILGGTLVLSGRGRAVLTATGMDSEMGKIAGMLLTRTAGDTPLQRKMKEVSTVLSLVCVGVCALMFGIGLFQQRYIPDLFFTAVALAVAAIPEGLPAIVTIVLAMGVSRMAKQNAIIRRLPAVETLGCASVICSDKTGTLTQNKMTVREVWTPEPALRRQALSPGLLCGDAKRKGLQFVGDPTETAIAALAAEEGLEKERLDNAMPRRGEAPFDSVRKRMSTCHAMEDGGYLVAVKGAPEAILSRCVRIEGERGSRPLTKSERKWVETVCAQMAGKALRVLAVAQARRTDLPAECTAKELERDLTFVGLIGMLDPPRPEAKEAVARCVGAGVRPVMITGDHKDTAVAIAGELGILRPGDRAIDGAEMDFLPQQILEEDIGRFSVFARVTPEHKMRIVRAWQRKGHVVAMTGDGVNDAPALRTADIGCAMGRSGTEVAKGASDMILTDDNFSTVVQAVEEGRGIYANIRKAIHYLLSCNIGEILAIFLATALAFPFAPLTPVQLLWLNLVTDSLPALALGMEPVERSVMERQPRGREEALFSREFSLRLAWQGAMVGGLTLLAYRLGLSLTGSWEVANTMAFATLTFSQLFHAFDVRSEDCSLLEIGVFSNEAMNRAFLAGMLLQGAVLLLKPLQGAFSVVPMDRTEWAVVLLLALTPLIVCEAEKSLRRSRMRYRRWKEEQAEKEQMREEVKEGR